MLNKKFRLEVYIPTGLNLGFIIFVSLFNLCVIFAFCWHAPLGKDFISVHKEVVQFFYLLYFGGSCHLFASTGKLFASKFSCLKAKLGINWLIYSTNVWRGLVSLSTPYSNHSTTISFIKILRLEKFTFVNRVHQL